MAKLVALNFSLGIIRRSKHKKFVIFSDSLSSLLAIHSIHLETGYILKFIEEYTHLVNSGKLSFYVGSQAICGNERADAVAKAALGSLLSTAVKCPAADLYHNLAIHCQRL